MQSSLYECRVMHHRFAPKAHHFSYRIFLFAIDLDELPALSRRFTLFSVDRANLYSFRDRDYLPTGETLHNGAVKAGQSAIGHSERSEESPPSQPAGLLAALGMTKDSPDLKTRVVAYLAARGVDLTGGRVLLVTLPRIFGYGFNPVSFYFCYDRAGQPVAALAEVTNTFREMKPYYLGPETVLRLAEGDGEERRGVAPSSGFASLRRDKGAKPGHGAGWSFRRRMPKDFYVSPYSDVDVAFDFDLRAPGGRLLAQIDDFRGSERTLTSTVVGEQRELTGARLAWWTLKYPLLTLRVITLIHWHALQLWLKRLPWFSKAARAGEQRDLYRPHASIAQPAEQP